MSQLNINTPQQGEWSVVDEGGSPIITFTSFIKAESKSDAKAPSQPVEEGGFATYNKVANPNETRVEIALQGKEAELGNALKTLDEQLKAANIIRVTMPTGTTPDSTLTGYNYTRSAENGLGVLYVELVLQEVRQVKKQYTNTDKPIKQADAKRASDSSPTEGGRVQTKEPSKSTVRKIGDYFRG